MSEIDSFVYMMILVLFVNDHVDLYFVFYTSFMYETKGSNFSKLVYHISTFEEYLLTITECFIY